MCECSSDIFRYEISQALFRNSGARDCARVGGGPTNASFLSKQHGNILRMRSRYPVAQRRPLRLSNNESISGEEVTARHPAGQEWGVEGGKTR